VKIIIKITTLQLFLAVFLSGCAGYDRVLFATKTNIGLDIDSTPPTAEITIARREVAIQPTFPDRKKPQPSNGSSTLNLNNANAQQIALPLLASFGLQGSFFDPSITGYFAGGAPAISLISSDTAESAKKDSPPPSQAGSSICLMNFPDIRDPLKKAIDWLFGIKPEDSYDKSTRPFYFATDTSFGLKAAWTGTGSPVPDALKIGYNRKEFASAPIFIYDGCDSPNKGKFNVKLPEFMAIVDNASFIDSKVFGDSGVKHVQFFATGLAATEFAKRPSVKKIAFEQMAPDAAALEATDLNDYLLTQIKEVFNKTNDAKKSIAVQTAINKKMVPESTGSDKFLDELGKNKKLISQDLNLLRKQLVDPAV